MSYDDKLREIPTKMRYTSQEMREAAYNADPGVDISGIIPDGQTNLKMLECAGLREPADKIRQRLLEDHSKATDKCDQSGPQKSSHMEATRTYVEVYKYLRGELGLTGDELRETVHLIMTLDWRVYL